MTTYLPPNKFEPVGVTPPTAEPVAASWPHPCDAAAGSTNSENAAPECHGSLPSGESDPAVTPDCAGAAASSCGCEVATSRASTEEVRPDPLRRPVGGRINNHLLGEAEVAPGPHDQVIVDRALLEQLMAELQELAGLRAILPDYERLLEKERIELLIPRPIFLRGAA